MVSPHSSIFRILWGKRNDRIFRATFSLDCFVDRVFLQHFLGVNINMFILWSSLFNLKFGSSFVTHQEELGVFTPLFLIPQKRARARTTRVDRPSHASTAYLYSNPTVQLSFSSDERIEVNSYATSTLLFIISSIKLDHHNH